ncbi:histidine kinase [Massilia sp. PAMC28688]|uniref:sensor histidine kinase n=1 Tax=Massilia sp. PAMC28688 TaxID=2861283 RepID=UPI001C6279FE|nr:histidine kinase [Massilia sp. PAMC28688]QYF95581.1 histidine kinase [Massilia sp. PAMC28688]
MWNKLVARHRRWEQDSMRMLERPGDAATLAPGPRQRMHAKVPKLSDIERMQLRNFIYKYRGWRSYAWIAAMMMLCSLFGVLVHYFMPDRKLINTIVVANLGGLGIALSFVLSWFNYRQLARKPARVGLFMAACLAVGVLVGAALRGMERGLTLSEVLNSESVQFSLGLVAGTLSIMVPLAMIAMWRNQQYEALTATMQLEAERERSARIMSESQLRLLRAQIEPHFLFNTLGAVQQLAQDTAPRAAELTANLIAFLRSSLDGMRRDTVTLRDDFALVEAYLQVMQMRMGTRLRYRLDLPAALAAQEVPSMMLLTLAENAIKHGLEPALRGGEMTVSAALEQGVLHLSVRDSGVGLSAQPGNGEGLANIRQRLQLAYGNAASLALTEMDAGGVAADILLPLERTSA